VAVCGWLWLAVQETFGLDIFRASQAQQRDGEDSGAMEMSPILLEESEEADEPSAPPPQKTSSMLEPSPLVRRHTPKASRGSS